MFASGVTLIEKTFVTYAFEKDMLEIVLQTNVPQFKMNPLVRTVKPFAEAELVPAKRTLADILPFTVI